MFLDALLMVSDAQAVTADAVSTNTIDLGNPTVKRRVGTGEPIGFGVFVDVAADFTTMDETYAFEAISSATANLASPTVLTRRAILASLLTAGSRHFIPIPPGTPLQQFIGLNYDVGGTTPTITVTAHLMAQSEFDEWTAYAKGYSV
jgi:hypothetical protein